MIKQKTKQVLSFLLSALFVITAYATPTEEYTKNIERQQELEQEMASNLAIMSQASGETQAIQDEIPELRKAIALMTDELSVLDSQIEELDLEIEAASQELADQYSAYCMRVREIEEQGSNGYLALLFSAKSLTDVFNAVACIDELMDYDRNCLGLLEEKEQLLLSKKEELSDLRADQNNVVRQLKTDQNRLIHKIEQLSAITQELSEKNTEKQQELEELQLLAVELERRMNTYESGVTKDPEIAYRDYVLNTGEEARTPEGAAIMRYALQFLGGTYIWGGSKPSDGGFDCSGLVHYVYNQFGYKTHRVASEQYRYDGYPVERSDLQAGDLVLFRYIGTTTVRHIGLYLGDGFVLHASSPENGIKISSLRSAWYDESYLGAKRIIQS